MKEMVEKSSPLTTYRPKVGESRRIYLGNLSSEGKCYQHKENPRFLCFLFNLSLSKIPRGESSQAKIYSTTVLV